MIITLDKKDIDNAITSYINNSVGIGNLNKVISDISITATRNPVGYTASITLEDKATETNPVIDTVETVIEDTEESSGLFE